MVDIVNPYANPYLPSFVNQRPRINDNKPVVAPVYGATFSQIHSVTGFEGARSYAMGLANGSSEIISESDPETARIYIVAKDQNGEVFMQPFSLIPIEEPKPVTMEDLNSKMSELLDRINKLEEEKVNGQSSGELIAESQGSTGDAKTQSSSRNGSGVSKSASNNTANVAK